MICIAQGLVGGFDEGVAFGGAISRLQPWPDFAKAFAKSFANSFLQSLSPTTRHVALMAFCAVNATWRSSVRQYDSTTVRQYHGMCIYSIYKNAKYTKNQNIQKTKYELCNLYIL